MDNQEANNRMDEENEVVIKAISYEDMNGDAGFAQDTQDIEKEGSGDVTDKTENDLNKSQQKREIIRDGFGMISITNKETMEITGETSALPVYRFTLTNNHGVSVQVITYGATITSVKVPDKKGNIDDIALGFEDIEGYQNAKNPYFGATMGRVTGIVENSCFSIANEEYNVSSNFLGIHHANGGFKGFDKVLWHPHIQDQTLILSYMSRDGEEGFPGDIIVNRSFELNSKNELSIITTARCSKPTLIDVSTHVDWNLASNLAGASEIYNHYLMVNADRYAQKDSNYMMTGKMKRVNGTVFDFRIPRLLGRLIHKVPGGGYDNYLNLTRSSCQSVTFAARLLHPGSRRFLEILTDQPGITIYTGNKLYAKSCYTFGHPESCWSFKPFVNNEPSKEKSPTNEDETPDLLAEDNRTSEGDRTSDSKNPSKSIRPSEDNRASEGRRPSEDKRPSESKRLSEGNRISEGGDLRNVEENDIVKEERESIKDEPAMQGKMGVVYERHGGIRLVPHNNSQIFLKKRTQEKHVLRPDKTYRSITVYKFGVLAEKKPNLAEII